MNNTILTPLILTPELLNSSTTTVTVATSYSYRNW